MKGAGWKGSLLAACHSNAINWNAPTWSLLFYLNGSWLVSQCRWKSCFLLLKWNAWYLMLSLLRLVKGRTGQGAQPGSGVTGGRGVASVVPKFAGLAGCSKHGGEVTQVASLHVHPAVPPGPDSSHPTTPFLLEQFFPILSKNEKSRSLPRRFGGWSPVGHSSGSGILLPVAAGWALGECPASPPLELRPWVRAYGHCVGAWGGGWQKGSNLLLFAPPGVKNQAKE